jgi:hypothetical protein
MARFADRRVGQADKTYGRQPLGNINLDRYDRSADSGHHRTVHLRKRHLTPPEGVR